MMADQCVSAVELAARLKSKRSVMVMNVPSEYSFWHALFMGMLRNRDKVQYDVMRRRPTKREKAVKALAETMGQVYANLYF